jgi:peptidoglycan/LPS O-acetylase OafA/YrhL
MSTPVAAQRNRAEITALRACAVLLVVLYHLWPGRLPGGYIGVDVFFVISGFLITSHLLRESSSTGKIALGRFWARRARRLLPAAYLVLAASAVAVAAWMPVSTWQTNYRQIIASTLYVQNWVLAADSVDYLASDVDPAVAQHYWSLSIEEQFYLVWPLLILAAAVWARRRSSSPTAATWWAIGVPTAASLVFSLWITQANPAAAYFVTPARAWQFGAGGLLGLWFATRSSHRPRRAGPSAGWRIAVPTLASWGGFAALAWCGLTYDETTPFPGTAALLPVAATLAIIAAAEPLGRLSPTPVMRSRPVRFFGDISYSLYLWHWPPIVILPVVLGHSMGFSARVSVLVGAILAAAATKKWVEDPVRFTRRPALRRPLTALVATAAGAAVIVAGARVGVGTAVAVERTQQAAVAAVLKDVPDCFGAAAMDPQKPCSNPALDGTMIPAPAAAVRDDTHYPGCFTNITGTSLNDCTFGKVDDPSIPHVVLLGDSHALMLLPALEVLAKEGKISVTAQIKGSCAWTRDPINHWNEARVDSCQKWKAKLEPWLVEQAPTTDLILTTGYARFNGGTPEEQVKSMQAAWKPLAELGVPIVAVRDNPRHSEDPLDCLERARDIGPTTCAVKEKDALGNFDAFAKTAGTVKGSTLLDLSDYYCRDGICPSVIGGVTVYRDITHLTQTYSRTLAPYIHRELVDLGVLPGEK